jgi:predicted NBD/HSP70 family sugar kinase
VARAACRVVDEHDGRGHGEAAPARACQRFQPPAHPRPDALGRGPERAQVSRRDQHLDVVGEPDDTAASVGHAGGEHAADDAALEPAVAGGRRRPPAEQPQPEPQGINPGAADGLVHFSPNLGWEAVSLGPLLVEATGLEAVNVENDAKTLAVAEQLFGDGGRYRSFAVAKVRRGVSCGLFLDHELYRGTTGMAGELGHLVFEPGGNECRCRGKGCLETIASRDAMLDAVQAAGRPNPASIDELAALARRGDEVALAAIERAGEALGRGLAMLLNLLNLELVVLYAEEPLLQTPTYLRSVRASVEAYAFSSAARDCEIIPKVITNVEEARAAGSMAFQPFYSST